ncbi:MAG: hypothetical protein WBD25_05025 [Terriglobales bacterium]
MKIFVILAALAFSAAASGQTICQLRATGPQPYSVTGTGVPIHTPGALDEFLGYIPQPYVALPGMPASPLAFCGPAWQPNYAYAVGNLIQLSNGTVLQAISCTGLCNSGATQPAGFSGTLFEPSPQGAWISTCSDPGTTATCTTVDATGRAAPVNFGEPYVGPDVGATIAILAYSNSVYNGTWTVTASTTTAPYTFSFTATGLGDGDCSTIGNISCIAYQQGSQVHDNQIVWQDVGPQNESTESPSFAITGSAVSINPGATTGNTSTITVTPSGAFSGSVALTAAITSSPSGAQDLPTLSSLGTVVLNGTGAVTSTLTIATTAPNQVALAHPVRPNTRWYNSTGVLAFALFFGMGIPAPRRNRRIRLGMLVLFVALIAALSACGGSGSAVSGSGTTPGIYTITVTGTSGSTTAKGTVNLTVL